MNKLDIALIALEKIYDNSNNTDFVTDTVNSALELIRAHENDWAANIKHNPPPNEVMVQILCDDYMGEFTMKAMRKDYKKPSKGQSKKGFRKGWRWIGPDGQALTRKETPSAWRYL